MLIFLLVLIVGGAALYGGANLVDEEKVTASADEDEGGETVVPGQPVSVTIVAKNILFDKKSFAVGVGVPVTVTLDNQDAGVLHNIAFYTNRSATQLISPDAKSPLEAGVRQDTITFTAPAAAASVFYRCDVHPDTMTGTMSVQ